MKLNCAKTQISVVLLTICLLTSAATADVLTIPGINNNTNTTQDIARPERGLTMEEVRARFGEPNEIKSPVGDPPITRWIYDRFTVHFEYNRVIHSVIHK